MAQRDDEKSKAQPSWTRTAGGTHDQLLEENWLFRLRKERFESRIRARCTIIMCLTWPTRSMLWP